MTIHQIKAAAEIARTRTTDKRWLAAIEKALAGIESGWWIVTELATCLAITTETGNTYFANGVCQCEAFKHSTACKHRALYRLYQIAQETAPAVSPTDEEIAADECDEVELRIERAAEQLASDIATSDRRALIAEIKNIWPRFAPGVPLAVELMARFRVNQLEMLDDGCLRDIRLAIAM